MESNTSSVALVVHSHADNHTDRLTLPFRIFTIQDQTIKIHQAFKGDGRGGTTLGHGAAVYPASIVLSHYIEFHARVAGKTILELGGGHGFSGIAAAVCGAKLVVSTDGDDTSLALTKKNIAQNEVGHNCQATKLLWGDCSDITDVYTAFGNAMPNLIIGSDVTACPYAEALPKLLQTMIELSNENTTILLSHKSRNIDEESFWSQASAHFVVQQLDRFIHPDFLEDESLHLTKMVWKK